MRQQIKIDDVWVEGAPEINEWCRQQVGVFPNGDPIWQEQRHTEQAIEVGPIIVTVDLSEAQCKLGAAVNYTITFSQPITVPLVVPISVSDRNGKHITNIGCDVTNGLAEGSFIMAVAGDFTVTDEAINFHHTVIAAPLKLTEQPWLRVYQ